MRRVGRIIFLAVTLFSASGPAFAYIDPNAGGLLYQILAPLLIVLATGYTFLKRRIAELYNRLLLRFSGKQPAE